MVHPRSGPVSQVSQVSQVSSSSSDSFSSEKETMPVTMSAYLSHLFPLYAELVSNATKHLEGAILRSVMRSMWRSIRKSLDSGTLMVDVYGSDDDSDVVSVKINYHFDVNHMVSIVKRCLTPPKKKKYVKKGRGPLDRKVRYPALLGKKQTAEWHRQHKLTQYCNIQVQSGRVLAAFNRQADRDDRDKKQQASAKAKEKQAYKAVPKDMRKREILQARDKRSPVEPQGGKLLNFGLHAATFGLAGLCLKSMKLIGQISNTLKKGDKILDDTSGLTQQLGKLKHFMQEQFKSIWWAIPFVMTIYYLVTKAGLVSPVMGGFIALSLAPLLGKKLYNVVEPFFKKGLELQSGAESVSRLFASLMAFSIFKDGCSQKVVGEFMRRISTLERAATGWEAFVSWFLKAFEVCINWVRSRFGKERIQLLRDGKQFAIDWCKKVEDLEKSINICENKASPEQVDQIVRLVVSGGGMRDLYRGTPMQRVIDDRMGRLYGLLAPFQGALNASNNFRVEPVSMMITGKPGIGKTVSTLYICGAVLKLSGILPADSDANSVKSNVWQKGNSKYWNSYAGQAAMILDDAFQWRGDPTDPENEFMTLIKAKSSWCMPLEFADVASKGRNFFNSKFILGTCNNKSIYTNAALFVNEPEAVGRRIDYGYVMSIVPEYGNELGHLDKVKFQRELQKCMDTETGVKRFPWYMWEMRKHDFMSGHTVTEATPMLDVVEQIANDIKSRLSSHGSDEDMFGAFVEGVKPQAGKPIQPEPEECKGCSARNIYRRMLEMELKDSQQATQALSFILGVSAGFVLFPMFLSLLKGTLTTAWSILTGIFGKRNKNVQLQSNVPKTKAVGRSANGPSLQTSDTHLQCNAYNNSYKMVIMDSAPYVVGQVIFLCDQLVVQPEHFTSIAINERLRDGLTTEDTKIKFFHASQTQHSFELTVRQYLSFRRISDATNDVEFVKFEDVRSHRNITGNFLTEKQIKYADGSRATLDLCTVDRAGKLVEPVRVSMILGGTSLGYGLKFSGRQLLRYFRYSAPTTAGDCGAPVSLMESASFSGRAIFGIHTTGDTKKQQGYCSIVTSEMITHAISQMNIIIDDFERDLQARGLQLQAGDAMPFSEPGSFLPIGTVSKSVVSCPYTSYFKTSMYGAFGDYKCLPAPLSRVMRAGQAVQPMDNAVKPYSTQLLFPDKARLKDIAHVAFGPLTQLTAKKKQRDIFDFETAIKGIPELQFRSIPRGTSAGYPYNQSNTQGGKKDFFGDGQDYDLTTPAAVELKARVDHIINSARASTRLANIFQDVLKDELRSEKKVEAVATRLISSSPLDYTVVCRQYFGAFSAEVMKYHVESGMAPGICVYTEWNMIGERLTSKGDKVFAGDFKAFDSSEQPGVMSVILDYINAWYNDGPENARIREVLWTDLVHSRHIGGFGADQRYIYQWNKSLPSGHPLTTIINSMYSLLLIVACYTKLTGDWTGFWSKCFTVTYGDDNVTNVSDDVADKFNQVTVAQVMWDDFGMVYTSDNKESALQPYTDISGVSFLKRRFFNEGNFWKCPLDLESFLYCAYWCKNKRLEKAIREDELENALEELSMHEQQTWDKHAPAVYEALSETKLPKAPLRRDAYYREVVSRSDNWY